MKANKFVKKYGWRVARDLAYRDKTSVGYLSVEHHDVCQDDLKHLIESYELVEEYGGLSEALEFIKYAPTVPEIYELRNAIEEVESCNE